MKLIRLVVIDTAAYISDSDSALFATFYNEESVLKCSKHTNIKRTATPTYVTKIIIIMVKIIK